MQWLLRMMFQSGAGGICPEFPEYVAKQGLQARATYEKLAQQVAAMEAAAAGAVPDENAYEDGDSDDQHLQRLLRQRSGIPRRRGR